MKKHFILYCATALLSFTTSQAFAFNEECAAPAEKTCSFAISQIDGATKIGRCVITCKDPVTNKTAQFKPLASAEQCARMSALMAKPNAHSCNTEIPE